MSYGKDQINNNLTIPFSNNPVTLHSPGFFPTSARVKGPLRFALNQIESDSIRIVLVMSYVILYT